MNTSTSLGRPSNIDGPLGQLIDRVNGIQNLAKLAGFGVRTIQRGYRDPASFKLRYKIVLNAIAQTYGTQQIFVIS